MRPPCISCTAETGDDLTGLRGQRIYLLLREAGDIPRAGAALVDRFWAAGHGRMVVSAAGAALERCPVEASVWQPERLDFAAGAVCEAGLVQRRGAPLLIAGSTEPVDTRIALPDDPEIARVAAAARRRARADANDAIEAAREAFLGSQGATLLAPEDRDDPKKREAARAVIRREGSPVDKKLLYRLLSNRVYLGKALHKGAAYPGEHAAIVDRDLWDRVHAILQESPRKRSSRTRAQTPALLKGLLYGPGGAAFSPTHTRNRDRLYRYYVSQAVLKHGREACPIGRVPAGEIESAVIDQLRAVFRQPEIVVGTWRAARDQDDGITEAEVRDALLQLDPLWYELFPAEQARIVQLLVERVEIAEDELDIRLRTDGLAGLVREFGVDARAAA